MAAILLMNPIIAIISFERGDVSLEKEEKGERKRRAEHLSMQKLWRCACIAGSCVPARRPYLSPTCNKCDGLDLEMVLNTLSWSLWLKGGQCINRGLG